jgi:hypothetical protein
MYDLRVRQFQITKSGNEYLSLHVFYGSCAVQLAVRSTNVVLNR